MEAIQIGHASTCELRCVKIILATPLPRAEFMEGRGQEEDGEVPEEIEDQCIECHHALASVERLLKPLLATSHGAVEEKLSPLDNASLTLLMTYTMNSLFWVYMTAQGVAPKTHPIKTELDRIQKYMHRATILTQRQKGEVPKVDTAAAKRFVKSALWDEEESSKKKRKSEGEEESADTKVPKKRKKQSDN